jgi:hypothetical protein
MRTLTFPGGQVVKVDFDDIQHSYVVSHKLFDDEWTDWRPTTGVTTPLSRVVVHDFIKPWVAKEVCIAALAYARDNPAILEDLADLEQDTLDYTDKVKGLDGKTKMTYYKYNKKYPFLKEIKKAPDNKSNESKELGTWLHSAIEEYYKSGRKTKPINTAFTQGMWDSFIQFDNYFKPVPDPDGLEFLVYSLSHGYSGQGDFRGQIFKGHVIGDWKSTSRSSANPDGISVEYFYQVGGLAQAEYERTGEWVDDLFIANFDKKGEEPITIFASDCGFSPQDCAKYYVSCYNNYHVQQWAERKFKNR